MTLLTPLLAGLLFDTMTQLIPLLAGLAQCAELCWQLRGQADKRQVTDAKVGLQHNIGLGGAVVVTLYKMGFNASNQRLATNATTF